MSIPTPKSFTLSEFSLVLLCGLVLPLLLSVVIDWNLSGIYVTQLFVNLFIAHSAAFSNFLIKSYKSLEKAEMLLLSTKSCKLAVPDQRNRSLTKMLKRIGPNTVPFAISRSWRMQSKALERSISTVPSKFLLFNPLFNYSIDLKRTWFALYAFLYVDTNSPIYIHTKPIFFVN